MRAIVALCVAVLCTTPAVASPKNSSEFDEKMQLFETRFISSELFGSADGIPFILEGHRMIAMRGPKGLDKPTLIVLAFEKDKEDDADVVLVLATYADATVKAWSRYYNLTPFQALEDRWVTFPLGKAETEQLTMKLLPIVGKLVGLY